MYENLVCAYKRWNNDVKKNQWKHSWEKIFKEPECYFTYRFINSKTGKSIVITPLEGDSQQECLELIEILELNTFVLNPFNAIPLQKLRYEIFRRNMNNLDSGLCDRFCTIFSEPNKSILKKQIMISKSL